MTNSSRVAMTTLAFAAATATAVGLGACAPADNSQRSDSAGGNVGSSAAAAPSVNGTQPMSATGTKTGKVPPIVDSIGVYSEGLYDAVKAGQWAQADKLSASLAAAAPQAPREGGAAADSLQRLASVLQASVKSRNRLEALKQANQATYLAAEMTRPYGANTPTEILLLDYEGRELEIWSQAKNSAKLALVKQDIRKLWNALRPTMQAHSATAEIQAMDSIVTRVEGAKTPHQDAGAAKLLLDEVDLLEKVFTHQ